MHKFNSGGVEIAYQTAGEIQAWKAELLDGKTPVAHQESFLW